MQIQPVLKQGATQDAVKSWPNPMYQVCAWSGGDNVAPNPGILDRAVGAFTAEVPGRARLQGAE